jgi:hypothetical protein
LPILPSHKPRTAYAAFQPELARQAEARDNKDFASQHQTPVVTASPDESSKNHHVISDALWRDLRQAKEQAQESLGVDGTYGPFWGLRRKLFGSGPAQKEEEEGEDVKKG